MSSNFLMLPMAGVSRRVVEDLNTAPSPIHLQGKVVCIGASITFGEGVAPAECYVGLLKAKVEAEKLPLQVSGQGRPGWSTTC
jgi:hypothetical protein